MLDRLTRTHLRLGSLAGVPVGLNLSWVIAAGMVVWSLGSAYLPAMVPQAQPVALWSAAIAGMLLFFGSVLAHELGHAVTARLCGIEVREITLFVLGGVSRIAAEPRTAGEELWIAAAGPSVSLALAVVTLAIGLVPLGALSAAVFLYLALVNLALTVFNLVPALPLDGGRILRALLWKLSGNPITATRWSAGAGRVCGVSLAALGAVSGVFGFFDWCLWLLLIGLFIERCARSVLPAGEAPVAALPILRASGETLLVQTEVLVDEATHDVLLERVVSWRARLDALPRPGELSREVGGADPVDPGVGPRYIDDRMEMYRLLGDADLLLRSRLEESKVQGALSQVSAIYRRWQPQAVAEATDGPEAAELAGRPESLAPSPEEALEREPGRSIEF